MKPDSGSVLENLDCMHNMENLPSMFHIVAVVKLFLHTG